MKNESDVFGVEKTVMAEMVRDENRDNNVALTKVLCTQFCTGTTCLCTTSD
jgi:hypothetical protein